MTNPVYRFSELLIMLYEQPIYILIALVVLCVCLLPPILHLYLLRIKSKYYSSAEDTNKNEVK